MLAFNGCSTVDEFDFSECTALTAIGSSAFSYCKAGAGFDTYDTCVRAHRIFGVTRAIIVTQDFHEPRAVSVLRDSQVSIFDEPEARVDLWAGPGPAAARHPAQGRPSGDRDPTT